ncbi:unnamed protein product [Brassicogethes aeneus]|uniref:RING-type domain-containing protein n=1 Tax=Brassicogethes aeneus TaxID=1431903 RepID=A0A9P0F8F7_BRAAE|nr:unnamed protein product [Brassicogethes aeneus]
MSKKKDDIADLICKSCKLYLSIAPIVISKSFNGPVCGRCKNKLNPEDYTVADFYEALVKTKSFPCRFQKSGCKVVTKWGYVSQHENSCRYTEISCPIWNCKWRNKSMSFNEHIKKDHDKLIQNPVKCKIDEGFSKVVAVSTVGQDFFIAYIIKKKGGKVIFTVTMNGSEIQSACYRYQVEIFDEKEENSIILRKNHCYTFKDSKTSVGIDITLNNIKNILNGSTNLVAKFGIVKKNDKEINKIMAKHQQPLEPKDIVIPKSTIKFDQDILSELECPICQEYMYSPIFICASGHSFCSGCIQKMSICPTCRCSLKNKTRNFSLEKIAAVTKVPCRNEPVGCSFYSSVEKILEHEDNCSFQVFTCFFNCNWKGDPENFMLHIRENHADKLFQMNTKYTLQDNETRIISMKNEVFIFTLIYSKNRNVPLEIKVEKLNDKSKQKYVFKFEFLHAFKRFVLADSVLPYSKNNKNIIISNDIVKKFDSGGNIFYNLVINKNDK